VDWCIQSKAILAKKGIPVARAVTAVVVMIFGISIRICSLSSPLKLITCGDVQLRLSLQLYLQLNDRMRNADLSSVRRARLPASTRRRVRSQSLGMMRAFSAGGSSGVPPPEILGQGCQRQAGTGDHYVVAIAQSR
jgi:hypothetical protein